MEEGDSWERPLVLTFMASTGERQLGYDERLEIYGPSIMGLVCVPSLGSTERLKFSNPNKLGFRRYGDRVYRLLYCEKKNL